MRNKSSKKSNDHRSGSKYSDGTKEIKSSKIKDSKKPHPENKISEPKEHKKATHGNAKLPTKKITKTNSKQPNKSSVKSQTIESKKQSSKIGADKDSESEDQTYLLKGVDEPLIKDSWDLPDNYKDHRLIFIARDPKWAFCFWEIDSEKLEPRLRELDQSYLMDRWKLRVYRYTSGKNELGDLVKDSDIDILSGKIYLELSPPGSTFKAELGVMDKQNNFARVLISNGIDLPPDSPSEIFDEVWTKGENIQEANLNPAESKVFKSGLPVNKNSMKYFGESSASRYQESKK